MNTRIVFFPGGGMGDASARTRLYYYLPFLNRERMSYHVASYSFHRDRLKSEGKLRSPLQRTWLELLPVRVLFCMLFCDTVWFQKLSVRTWVMRLARLLGKRIVYDLDDAIYLKPPTGEGRGGHAIELHAANAQILASVMRCADVVTVSGAEIAVFARQYAKKVRVLPSLIGSVSTAPATTPDPPVIVWVGAPENLRYLLAIEAVLLRLQEEFSNLVIRLITSELPDMPCFRYEHIPWSIAAESEWIPRSTVGVAPLADDEWCRAKLNYKALVYISYGVPAVVTPGGFPLAEFEAGESVLVARTGEDWYKQLRAVLEQPGLRRELAERGRNIVQSRFMADAHVAEFEAVLSG